MLHIRVSFSLISSALFTCAKFVSDIKHVRNNNWKTNIVEIKLYANQDLSTKVTEYYIVASSFYLLCAIAVDSWWMVTDLGFDDEAHRSFRSWLQLGSKALSCPWSSFSWHLGFMPRSKKASRWGVLKSCPGWWFPFQASPLMNNCTSIFKGDCYGQG